MNCKRVKEMVKELYGEIAPVQIEELMMMILGQVDRLGGWDDIVLWKMDLKGAFNLVFFRPEDVGLLAMELSDGLTMVSLVGSFGHTATPFGFDVVSRAILADVLECISGDAGICCDDIMGCCSQTERVGDMRGAQGCVEALLGSQSVAPEKTTFTTPTHRQIDFIGWSVDLNLMRLGIARHNVLKVFHGFCESRSQRHLSARVIQKLASWSSRYSLVCRWMRPFAHYLYAAGSGFRNLETQVEVSDNMRLVIDLWIMFLVLMELEPFKFTRPILSFRADRPSLHINLDASLTGLGMIISRVHRSPQKSSDTGALDPDQASIQTSDVLQVIAVVGYRLPFASDLELDSSYQNSNEFIAIVVALLLLMSLGYRGVHVAIQGDSTTALSWVSEEKFRAGRSTAASVCYMQLHQCGGEPLLSCLDHVAGLDNKSDPLSRDVDPVLGLGYNPMTVVMLERNPTLCRLIQRMNPSVALNIHNDLHSLWSRNREDIQTLLGTSGGWVRPPWLRSG